MIETTHSAAATHSGARACSTRSIRQIQIQKKQNEKRQNVITLFETGYDRGADKRGKHLINLVAIGVRS